MWPFRFSWGRVQKLCPCAWWASSRKSEGGTPRRCRHRLRTSHDNGRDCFALQKGCTHRHRLPHIGSSSQLYLSDKHKENRSIGTNLTWRFIIVFDTWKSHIPQLCVLLSPVLYFCWRPRYLPAGCKHIVPVSTLAGSNRQPPRCRHAHMQGTGASKSS